ncbi:LacI family DNA-binding transcriptional regulator [Microbacterium sp. 22242]|uniref:LacI family DNA-binding transcriptional regulator n=1 Tax=Microbacterium sp. 22242 TaxID=3453896 RepID=UPI003F831ABA
MAGRVGIRDVARVAGVSLTTVSHSFSGRRAVNPETRDRIFAVAAGLGYIPDPYARTLRTSRSSMIALLSDTVLTTPYAGRIVTGAQAVADEHGYALWSLESGGLPSREERHLLALRARKVDGILIARTYHQRLEIPPALGDVPVVVVDAHIDDQGISMVAPDEPGIAATAVQHLLAHGHRRIAYVAALDDTPATQGREQGYRDTLQAAGIPLDEALIVRAESTAPGGRVAIQRLLDLDDRPTAVFCFNDQMAMGVYQGAKVRGLGIPADLSVVGVDDLDLISAALDPGLTTVALPHVEMGMWAAARLFEQLADPEAPAQHNYMRCALVERGSVAAHRSAVTAASTPRTAPPRTSTDA